MSRLPNYLNRSQQPLTPHNNPNTQGTQSANTVANNTITPRLAASNNHHSSLRCPNLKRSQELAQAKLDEWVATCPNASERRNWRAVADQMESEGVFLDERGRLKIEGDLFANDFTGLIAPHYPLALPDNLTVTGRLDLGFFSGLRSLPRGLEVGKRLILTTIQNILDEATYPIIENQTVINARSLAEHSEINALKKHRRNTL